MAVLVVVRWLLSGGVVAVILFVQRCHGNHGKEKSWLLNAWAICTTLNEKVEHNG
ncbi:Hypothetical predicted protein [Olea europaea subsp. europaea]|uniref:Uncharacterized protein n=1 Tax=Olea europaea subsp. europaea TaxID=158383 RepID=A0A8S0RSG3_OLEEU|nr:Hypothetical predicted protein [Olea europaea subsp. europaea]